MNIRDLREILNNLGEELDEKLVLISVGKNEREEEEFMSLDDNNWEIGGTTEENSFLKLYNEHYFITPPKA